VPSDVPLWNWFNIAIFEDKYDYRPKFLMMDNSIRFLPLQRYVIFLKMSTVFFFFVQRALRKLTQNPHLEFVE